MRVIGETGAGPAKGWIRSGGAPSEGSGPVARRRPGFGLRPEPRYRRRSPRALRTPEPRRGGPMSETPTQIDFFDPETNDCPYPAYQQLRDEAPVWLDPRTGMYFVTRYEDIRAILLDTKRYSNGVGNGANDTGKASAGPRGAIRSRSRAGAGSRSCTRRRGGRRRRASTPGTSRITCRCGGCSTTPSGRRRSRRSTRTSSISRTSCSRVPRRRHVRVGVAVRRAAAAVRDRPPGRRAGRGPAADQGLDGQVGQADGPDADRRGGEESVLAEIEAQHYFQPMFEQLRQRAGRHAAEHAREPRDPRVGPPAERQRAPRRDDGRPRSSAAPRPRPTRSQQA